MATPHPLLQGIVAILRGLRPEEAPAVGQALVDAGVRVIEVPLNSPSPLESIRLLAQAHGDRVLVGAGTVLAVAEVDAVADAGARLVLSPCCDPAVIRRCRERGLLAMPGVATPTEGFQALAAGADALKLFPAEALAPPVLKAWRAVFSPGTPMFAVGGVGEHNLAAFRAAGATGVGTGSALYSPGTAPDVLQQRARRLVQAWADAG